MIRALHIAEGFSVPIEAVTETFAVLAKRGSGKTYAASVLVEEFVSAGQPVCVVDPVGVWWGLRSSADGNGPGLPVVILGGDHADLPLDEHAGAAVADLLIDERLPLVLDLSHLSKSGGRRFVTAFLERLYHRNRDPLHLVIDEADLFAPQRGGADTARLLGAYEDVVRRGRARGLGCTSITQRPAVLHKDILTQAEVLIALRMTGVRDVAAIDEWVRLHAEDDEAKRVKASLPSLPVGTAWVWSPGWLQVLQQVQIRRRHTFDSSATPKPGQRPAAPRQFAPVDPKDLQRLSGRLASPEVPAAQNGTGTTDQLLRLVEELRRDLALERNKKAQVVEVPAVSDEQITTLVGVVGNLIEALDRVQRPGTLARPSAPKASAAPVQPQAPRKREVAPPAAEGRALGRAERAILTVLAQHGRRSTTQVALLTGYSHKSGGFRNALSSLRSAGFIDGRGEVQATTAGVGALGDYEPLPTGRALVEWWYGQLSKAERTVLAVLVDRWPAEVPTGDIAALTDYSASSGGFRNALSRLRSLELASGRGALRAADVLGEAART